MNITTTKKHTIRLDGNKLQERFINHFIEVIQDFADSPKDLQTNIAMFNEGLLDIINGRWAKLFSDGYTMMLLDDVEMTYVEKFFEGKEKTYAHEDELVLLVGKDDLIHRVEEYNIDF